MLISPEKKYIPDLFSLWKRSFGDEDGYIRLFFDTEYQNCKTFASFENGEIVSVLYLLDCLIPLGGEKLDGWYLYAAATKPESRGRGLMSDLIREAQTYAGKENKAFIALVPGEESLYGYYRRFGFDKTMFKYRTETACDPGFHAEKCTREDYLAFRLANLDSCVQFEKDEFSYICDCYAYAGASLEKGEGFYRIRDEKTVYELLYENAGEVAGTEIYSQKPLSDTSEKITFGQLYFTSEETAEKLENAEIYMNHALD